jgi:ribosomal protein S16
VIPVRIPDGSPNAPRAGASVTVPCERPPALRRRSARSGRPAAASACGPAPPTRSRRRHRASSDARHDLPPISHGSRHPHEAHRAPQPPVQASLNVERARAWLEQGALPSHTVQTIFKRFGVYEGHENLLHESKRDRSGRRKDTAKAKARAARKADLEARKTARREARAAAKKAAAAAAAEGEGGDE